MTKTVFQHKKSEGYAVTQFGAYCLLGVFSKYIVPLKVKSGPAIVEFHPRKRIIRTLSPICFVERTFDEEAFWEEVEGVNYDRRKLFSTLGPQFGLYYVPPMTLSDGASIPRGFWNICDPFHPQVLPAAILHDYYYSRIDAAQADRMFWLAMKTSEYYSFGAARNYRVVRMWRPVRRLRKRLGWGPRELMW